MIDSTNAYKKLKEQIQESIDFAILCCHAVPALKGYMKAVDKGSAPKIPDPDFWGGLVQYERLKEISPNYRKVLGKYLVLSSFSYFEAFVTDVVKEIFEFHGGKDKFVARAIDKRDKTVAVVNTDTEKSVKKLREIMKPGKSGKYTKVNNELTSKGYRFPSDHFSAYGISHLWSQIDDGNVRASQIPLIIQNGLGLAWSDDEIDKFNKMRELRNEIAHGRKTGVDLSKAIDDNKFLRKLAIKIDKYIVKHYLIIEI